MRSRAMRSLALIAVVVAGYYYYYHQQHPAFGRHAFFTSSATPAPAATPVLHYHSPLDVGNTRGSAGYYSTEPTERYETTGPRSTASGRAALAQTQAQALEAKSQPKSPGLPDEP